MKNPLTSLVLLGLLAACASPRGLLVGESMDALSLPTLDGEQRSIEELRGRVVLVDVWASWCGPCTESIPFYADLANALESKGFAFVPINIDEDERLARDFLEAAGLKVEIWRDPGAEVIAPRYKVVRMPTAFLLDREGKIRHVHEGFVSGDKAQWRRRIEALLGEPAR